jgi:hypothetical protein
VIRVEPAPEPEHFDESVRKPGMSELAVLTGGEPTHLRTGPKRKQLVIRGAPVTRTIDIPADQLPTYWTRALPDMLDCYRRVCAYVCVYIERVTGAGTVDHWTPKAIDPRQAYEWSNFRLACSIMNTRKGVATALVDPFVVEDGWFVLEPIEFQVIPGVAPEHPKYTAIDDTINALGLNRLECLTLRKEYVAAYRDGDISLRRLERRAPFVARELRRQGERA